MLAFAIGVVVFRSPVTSAICLVTSFLGLASLYITLDAFFIGIIQVLVYAGAVMVLFLFIIMLLDLKAEAQRSLNLLAWIGGSLVLAGFVILLFQVIGSDAGFLIPKPELATSGVFDAREVGMTLFTAFNVPFQVLGVLLLVATVGVVLLSKRELK